MAHTAALLALGQAGCSEAQAPLAQQASPAADAAAGGAASASDAPAAMPAGARPVMLSGEAGNLDPCALAMIYDPPSGPEQGAVMVFGAATTDLDVIATLMHTDTVWVCEASGDMVGIVYPPDGEMDCELSSPVSGSQPYRGPCQTGWVKQQWVQVIAG